MTELTIQINNDSIIPSLKRILKAISGVVSVKIRKDSDKPVLYDPETGKELNQKTMKLIKIFGNVILNQIGFYFGNRMTKSWCFS